MDEYFTSVREIENQIDKLNKYANRKRADMKEPDEEPMTRENTFV